MNAGSAIKQPWLVLIDLQRVFAEADSPWCTPMFDSAAAGCQRLKVGFGDRVALSRFLVPEQPEGSWIPYYQRWPFALEPESVELFDLTADFSPAESNDPAEPGNAVLLDRTTFNKWDAAAAEALGQPEQIVLAGVSTDCCVLSTALAAADAGVLVQVVADACGGVSEEDHQRALELLSLYSPQIEVTTVDAVLESLAGSL
ncbi:nicotinamidase-related amidase [Psychromicrobium silvestre]|uniref:Nicotinamidase-related amidase n=1 Tax=Psychromicrobium silvestre TaxID=1645614 RepID=A0A7Y9LUR9_9MICC|nr:cysteine hydrolase [Psychromicrobium silvestre]NYE95966.1 nicotinamidase-related amidase [Psychromicrobium silvestre]